MAAYAAAGIADCNPSKCGVQAFKLAIGGFILPFFFVFNDVLLMNGSPLEIIISTVSAIVGSYGIAAVMEGQFWEAPIDWLGRLLCAAGAVCLISPDHLTDVIGVAIMVVVHVIYNAKAKHNKHKMMTAGAA